LTASAPTPRRPSGGRTDAGALQGGNRLLAAFPRPDLDRLRPDLEERRLARGDVLFEVGGAPGHACFPHAGTMVSLVLPTPEGGAIETVTVGREGFVGLGVDPTDATVEAYARAVVQMPGSATVAPAARIAEIAAASPALRRLLARHAEAAMSMALQSAACLAAHPVRARLARWLLTAADRAVAEPGRDPVLPLTQEFVAEMLGVRRATAGDALLALQAEGLLELRRGAVVLRDRPGLERASCACYAAVRRRWMRLLPEASADAAQR
jgi:CRP-like cAMP-binding protein